MLHTDLDAFVSPRTAVVLGASPRSGVALGLMRNLRRGGQARVTGIHPTITDVEGFPVVASIRELDHVPDLAAVAVGTGNIVRAVEDAVDAGVRAFVMPGLGPETGPDGAVARDALRDIADRTGVAMLGPNCMGIATPRGPSAWIATIVPSMRPGDVGVLVESGSIGEALTGMGPRLGLRAIVSSGNEIARDAADWTAWFAADGGTRVIGLFLESIRRPEQFGQSLRRAAEAAKPVIILKSGRSAVGAARALAHSGAIAGSHSAFLALCDAYGAVVVDDYVEWIEVLEAFSSSSPAARDPHRLPVELGRRGGAGRRCRRRRRDAGH